MTLELDFIAPEPGSWVRGYLAGWDTANHEAAHAVVAVVLGFTVLQARIDHPVWEQAGVVSLDPTDEIGDEHAIVTMAGPIAVDKGVTWPPLSNAERRLRYSDDEDSLALLVDYLGWREREWDLATLAATKILKDQSRAHIALGGSLLTQGALPGHRVEEIVSGALA